jgi:release factor glutamine methyltransferase
MTVDQALADARSLGLDRLDAMVLLAHHTGRSREWLIAHADAELDPATRSRFDTDCRRRADDVPVAYLTGLRDFHGLQLSVTPSVLVPRPETEVLVDWAVDILHGDFGERPSPKVIDLGTGSGAIALAVAAGCPHAMVTATDVSDDALTVARSNMRRMRLPLRLRQGSWWKAVPGERFDLALANPPYVAAGDRHLAALRHEPVGALVAPEDGLSALRSIVMDAMDHLRGWLLLEHGWNQARAVQGFLRQAGFRSIETRLDSGGHPRCTGGQVT